MINIISKSILEKRIRGPQKVVRNLIAGLDLFNYPHVENRALDSTNMLWIHDDISALSKINDLPDRVKVLIGPNLFINPEDIPAPLDLKRTLYLQPSSAVKQIWLARGFRETNISVWPAGVDTDKYSPSDLRKEYVLLYFKNRREEELAQVVSIFKERAIPYRVLRYGQYAESDFYDLLSRSKYIVWLGGSESQGLALEEALSMNVSALVIDQGQSPFGVKISAAPYFSEDCGRKVENLEDFPAALSLMEKDWSSFRPRHFIIENLNLERQAHFFLNFYQDYFHLSIDEEKRRKLFNSGLWKNSLWYYTWWYRLKGLIKRFHRY